MNLNETVHTQKFKEPLECALHGLQENIAKMDTFIDPNITIRINMDQTTRELCGDAVIKIYVTSGGWRVR